jgi:hypothetical protein
MLWLVPQWQLIDRPGFTCCCFCAGSLGWQLVTNVLGYATQACCWGLHPTWSARKLGFKYSTATTVLLCDGLSRKEFNSSVNTPHTDGAVEARHAVDMPVNMLLHSVLSGSRSRPIQLEDWACNTCSLGLSPRPGVHTGRGSLVVCWWGFNPSRSAAVVVRYGVCARQPLNLFAGK